MALKNSLATELKALFSALCVVMVATLLYTIAIDGLPFRKELLTPWMAATLVDFYINVVALAAWIIYKEANWISSTVLTILLICFGSITTCAYVVVQFMKLSSQESAQDPLHYILLRHAGKDRMEDTRRCSLFMFLRMLFAALGCLMLGTLIYTLLTDGSPFRRELLTPWMDATLVDFYINVVALSVWVGYKERNWVSAFFWILLLICFGGITTCAYITWQLFHITSQDPIYLILLRSSDRAENRYNTMTGETTY